MVVRVVDGRRPGATQAESTYRRKQVFDARPCLLVVGAVEVARVPGRFVRVAHPPQHTAELAGAPIDPVGDVEDHRQFVDGPFRQRFGDDHLMPGAAGRDPTAGRGAHRAELRAAGEHHVTGRDGAAGGLHPGDVAVGHPQSGERAVLPDVDVVGGQCRGVGQHVAGRVDVPVARRVRTTQRHPRGKPGVSAVDVGTGKPLHGQPEPVLQCDPFLRRGHLGLGEARHQVALRDEATVQRIPIAAGRVELLAAQPQPDRRLGAALRPDHPRSPAAGAIAQGVRLQQHDMAGAPLGELHRRPRSDGAAADHDDVRTLSAGHSPRPWHRLNAQSIASSERRSRQCTG